MEKYVDTINGTMRCKSFNNMMNGENDMFDVYDDKGNYIGEVYGYLDEMSEDEIADAIEEELL